MISSFLDMIQICFWLGRTPYPADLIFGHIHFGENAKKICDQRSSDKSLRKLWQPKHLSRYLRSPSEPHLFSCTGFGVTIEFSKARDLERFPNRSGERGLRPVFENDSRGVKLFPAPF